MEDSDEGLMNEFVFDWQTDITVPVRDFSQDANTKAFALVYAMTRVAELKWFDRLQKIAN